jgi:hypothetical protein
MSSQELPTITSNRPGSTLRSILASNKDRSSGVRRNSTLSRIQKDRAGLLFGRNDTFIEERPNIAAFTRDERCPLTTTCASRRRHDGLVRLLHKALCHVQAVFRAWNFSMVGMCAVLPLPYYFRWVT